MNPYGNTPQVQAAQASAIALVDAALSGVALPTYSELRATHAHLLAALQAFVNDWGPAVDHDAPINGCDAVESIGAYVADFRVDIAKATRTPS